MFCVQGITVTDRFRELERPQTGRLKDVVLMATVTGFESLRIPRKSDMKQFAELFEPLFLGSSNEARRQAAAALSQCPQIPEPVAALIGGMPISIAAIFLTRSKAIGDRTLIAVIRERGSEHAAAIARRPNLSPLVVDALVEHHNPPGLAARSSSGAKHAEAEQPHPEPEAASLRTAREEALRHEIKTLARAGSHPPAPTASSEAINDVHAALLVRFARSGEIILFSRVLGQALGTRDTQVERILLDISGQRLATSLVALDVPATDAGFVLQALYPHLREPFGETSHAQALIGAMNRTACREQLDGWFEAEAEEATPTARHEAYFAENPANDARQISPRRIAAAAGNVPPQRLFGRRRG
ncbi:DUF2336 domain-containing protein [Ensifer adhaerens]|uniref:DUF2336 domain-containing protein n=1 Tax=Ensifer adhaerens TaxID=106592 RepID=UPI0023A9727A|nr:DUF2336 domain-containing protein [Ensifer adhaerens]WDZ77600.1 DUF2336 domain-containing protein [Ensifer adhaerens]